MMRSYKYLIVGAGLAGHNAAEATRERDEASPLAIIGAETHRPYNRPPLSKGLLKGQIPDDGVFIAKAGFYEEKGIELISGSAAVEIDAVRRIVTLAGGQGIGYENLLIATGGQARKLKLSDSDLDGIFTLRTLDDAIAIRNAAKGAKRIAVIGGGFIGAEVAASLCEMGREVTMIFPERTILGRVLPADFGEFLNRTYQERGVEIISGDTPVSLEGSGRVERIRTKASKSLGCDMAVVGIGIELQTGFARNAGLSFDNAGAILTDDHLRTTVEGIWAAGDVALYRDKLYGRPMRFEHWGTAVNQGRTAGAGMAGDLQPYTSPAYFFSVLFGMFIQIGGSFTPGDVVRRGGPDEKSVGYYSFSEGVIEGYATLGRSQEEEKVVQRLILDRRRKEEIGEALGDESGEIETL
jgi:3-phenylpropionate/trans-cinnamate dioxygenase ferredoxin reductase subunit